MIGPVLPAPTAIRRVWDQRHQFLDGQNTHVPSVLVDPFDDARAWQTTAPGGGPSAAFVAQTDTSITWLDAPTVALSGTAAASGHQTKTTVTAVDLTTFDDLWFWIHSDRLADGTPGWPFFLELRLGSAAVATGTAANSWFRELPVTRAGTWELVKVSLHDLAPTVRSALSTVQIGCIDAPAPFRCNVAALTGVHEQLLLDLDAALVARLSNRATLAGAPVPAFVEQPGSTTPPPSPSIRITNYDVQQADARSPAGPSRSDFRNGTFDLRPRRRAYDALYEIDVVASARPDADLLYELVLTQLGASSELVVNGVPQLVEIEPLPTFIGWQRPDHLVLRFRLHSSCAEPGTATPMSAVSQQVTVHTDTLVPS
jgi:hypothetical protein